jgi:hypothetical protein
MKEDEKTCAGVWVVNLSVEDIQWAWIISKRYLITYIMKCFRTRNIACSWIVCMVAHNSFTTECIPCIFLVSRSWWEWYWDRCTDHYSFGGFVRTPEPGINYKGCVWNL